MWEVIETVYYGIEEFERCLGTFDTEEEARIVCDGWRFRGCEVFVRIKE